MRNPAKFWNRIAKRYAKRPIADKETYEKKLELTREYFRPDTELLELGCGTGSAAIAHAPYVRHIRAVDISPKMLEIARRKAHEAGVGNVSFEQTTIEEVVVPDGSVDAVLGLNVLHLLEDMDGAIARVHDMLKPGGVFVTSTPCIGDSMAFLRMILPIGRVLGVIPRVRVFTSDELTAGVAGAGFVLEETWQAGEGKPLFIVARK